MIAPLILTLLGNTMKIPASARALSDVPGKTAHSGSQGQTGCEWALIVPSCAYSFFSDYCIAGFDLVLAISMFFPLSTNPAGAYPGGMSS